jgi:hypothetical protein
MPGLRVLFALVADVDLAGRILADDDHGQARNGPVIGFQPGRGGRYALHQTGRECLTVDDADWPTVSSPCA